MSTNREKIAERSQLRAIAAVCAILFSFSLTCGIAGTISSAFGLSLGGMLGLGTAAGFIVLIFVSSRIDKELPSLEEM